MVNFHGCMLPDVFSVCYATMHQFQAIQSFGHGIFDSVRFLHYNRTHVITISALLANWVRILRQVFLIVRVIWFSIIPHVLRLALIRTPQAFTYFQPQLGCFSRVASPLVVEPRFFIRLTELPCHSQRKSTTVLDFRDFVFRVHLNHSVNQFALFSSRFYTALYPGRFLY